MKPIKEIIRDNSIASYNEMFIELTSNTHAVIDNCSRVIEYNTKAITLAGHKKSVTFIGDNLELKNLVPTGAVIAGKIMAIEFDDRGVADDN